MEVKWYMIFLMVTGTAGVIGLSFGEFNKSNKSIEAIKAGLEECPNLNSKHDSTSTIFVKSCKEYTEEFYKFKENKED